MQLYVPSGHRIDMETHTLRLHPPRNIVFLANSINVVYRGENITFPPLEFPSRCIILATLIYSVSVQPAIDKYQIEENGFLSRHFYEQHNDFWDLHWLAPEKCFIKVIKSLGTENIEGLFIVHIFFESNKFLFEKKNISL